MVLAMDADRPTHRGIRHVALKCRDLDRLERFYVDLLGYEVEWRPDPDSVYLTNGHDSLAIHRDAGAPSDESRLDHFGVLMRTADDVDAWAAFLKTRGVAFDTTPRTHRDGCRSFYARDPENNRIQFLWHPKLSPAGR